MALDYNVILNLYIVFFFLGFDVRNSWRVLKKDNVIFLGFRFKEVNDLLVLLGFWVKGFWVLILNNYVGIL